jgi:hypothetical protein
VGTGPLTGFLERPSQGAQENRKAINRKDADARTTERDQIKASRGALNSAHRAEQKLMLARHAAELRHLIDGARAQAAAYRSSMLAAVTIKYAERLARVFDSGDAKSAWAARERLKLEEAIEIAQLRMTSDRDHGNSLRSLVAALRVSQRGERHGLTLRQRHQRAVLGVLLRRIGRPPGQPSSLHAKPCTAVRARPAWFSGRPKML